MQGRIHHACVAIAGAMLFGPGSCNVAAAQRAATIEFHIDEPTLDAALRQVGAQSGREIMYPADAVAGKGPRSLAGRMSADEAIRQLLRRTGLRAAFRADVVVIKEANDPSSQPVTPQETAGDDVIVTGTRIRGSAGASPAVTTSRETIRRQGFAELGSFARALPQNFSGGQNPGVVGGGAQGSNNENVTSSSTLNLRGLGSDATLTLIQGHRVAYDAASAGVDISAIPLLAVDRVEVVTDGSSALYGSDAVGGVANVILRSDLDGMVVQAGGGAATSGGDHEGQLSAAAGATWTAGNIMAALDYRRSSDIQAGQRSYNDAINPSYVLLPKQQQISAVLNLNQSVLDDVRFHVDAEYNHRSSRLGIPFSVDDGYETFGSRTRPKLTFYSVAPSLAIDLPGNWRMTASGGYSRSLTRLANQTFVGGTEISLARVRYGDTLSAAELTGEGPLFDLPGGTARASFGAGYRVSGLKSRLSISRGGSSSTLQQFDDDQKIVYGFGEVLLPFISPGQNVAAVRRLEISAAGRYEHYQGINSLFTPKIGVVYQPLRALTVKGTWGKSFKAPTLYQLNSIENGGLLPAFYFGVPAPAANDVIAYVGGGSRQLRPERARTWSVGATIEPAVLSGFTLNASYYHIKFGNRVVSPITSFAGLLDNPLYRDLVTLNPTAAQLASAEAMLPLGFTNQTGLPASSLNVIALVQGQLRNALAQRVNGVDLHGTYSHHLSDRDTISFDATASYLKLRQRLSPIQPEVQLSGTVFNPPHWRARAAGTWDRHGSGVTAAINYVGPVTDQRLPAKAEGDAFVSADLNGQIALQQDSGPLQGVTAQLSVINVLNEKPQVIRSSDPSIPPYDSTNYSSLGRVISLTVTKKW